DYPVKAMLPMVATLDEVHEARTVLAQARAATGIETPIELGIMVEVPAAALTAAQLADHVDFFSLGTNDLTQYTMAAERGDERLAPLLSGPQPAVLRLVQATVKAAGARGRWVGVCGELAGDSAAALLLVGLGVTELSMAPALVPDVKAALREVDLVQARATADAALEAESGAAARARLGAFLDTTADKLLVAAALIALVSVHRASAWVALVILAREFTILGLRAAVESGGRHFETSMLGKWKATVQFVAITLAILRPDVVIAGAYLDQWAMVIA